MDIPKIIPPKTWKKPAEHLIKSLSNKWYQILINLQDEIMKSTVQFYSKKKFKFLMLPITTGTISSPMGRGSDSKPVKINLEGLEAYLADSMQFFLKFECRFHKEGVYYIAPSFRG